MKRVAPVVGVVLAALILAFGACWVAFGANVEKLFEPATETLAGDPKAVRTVSADAGDY